MVEHGSKLFSDYSEHPGLREWNRALNNPARKELEQIKRQWTDHVRMLQGWRYEVLLPLREAILQDDIMIEATREILVDVGLEPPRWLPQPACAVEQFSMASDQKKRGRPRLNRTQKIANARRRLTAFIMFEHARRLRKKRAPGELTAEEIVGQVLKIKDDTIRKWLKQTRSQLSIRGKNAPFVMSPIRPEILSLLLKNFRP